MRKILKKVLILVLLAGFVVSTVLSIKSFLLFSTIQDVEDKIQFANNFNHQDKTSVELDKCTDWSDLLFSWCVKSPLFPYKRLDIKQIKQDNVQFVYEGGKETNLSTEGIWLLTDPIWQIFYVARLKHPEPLKYYGPYR